MNKTVFVFLLPLLLLCQCGVPSPPQCRQVPTASREDPARLTAAARSEWEILSNPANSADWDASRARYNAAVAKLFDQLRCGSADWETRAARLGSRIAGDHPDNVDPARLDSLLPASSVNGRKLSQRHLKDGLGVPVVGWRKTTPVGIPREPFQLPNGLPFNLTALLSFDDNTPVWHFRKRSKLETARAGRAEHPLAADWSAPNEFYWRMCQLDNLLLQNLLLPDRFTEETGVYFVTPYDPEKIPIVFVHGLVSSPDAFKNVVNALSPEPWFRENYQIWLYNYPTGNPWIISSRNFRESLRNACDHARSRGHDRKLNRMVVVGHSMGGLLARSSVTDPGRTLYDGVFRVPPDELAVSESARQLIFESYLYQPLSEPERVVFMAVPHRGSPMATLRPAEWAARLIRLPKTLTVELLDSTLLAVGDIFQGDDPLDRLPTSIHSLSPNNRSTVALNELPLPDHIAFHSVIGDRGRGNRPDCSDGVVPYWSSHVTPVASELIVPSNHGVPDCPVAAEELKRILQLHLEEKR